MPRAQDPPVRCCWWPTCCAPLSCLLAAMSRLMSGANRTGPPSGPYVKTILTGQRLYPIILHEGFSRVLPPFWRIGSVELLICVSIRFLTLLMTGCPNMKWPFLSHPFIASSHHPVQCCRLVPQGLPAEMMLLFIGAICCFFGILRPKETWQRGIGPWMWGMMREQQGEKRNQTTNRGGVIEWDRT